LSNRIGEKEDVPTALGFLRGELQGMAVALKHGPELCIGNVLSRAVELFPSIA